MTISQPKTYLKAIHATLVAVLGALAAVMIGDVGLTDVTAGQWLIIAGAGAGAFGGVYGLTNRPSTVTSST